MYLPRLAIVISTLVLYIVGLVCNPGHLQRVVFLIDFSVTLSKFNQFELLVVYINGGGKVISNSVFDNGRMYGRFA